MDEVWSNMKTTINRRSFVKNGLTAAGVATAGVGLLADSSPVFADDGGGHTHSRRCSHAALRGSSGNYRG